MRKLLFALLLVGITCAHAEANTIIAPTFTLTDVPNAINSAAPGDTVLVQAGTYNWSGGLSILGISLIGAGNSVSGTVITTGTVTVTKRASFHTRLRGFRFTGTGQHLMVQGIGNAFIIDNNSSAGTCGDWRR